MAKLFKPLFFIFAIICFVAAIQAQGQQCGPNEEFTTCGSACQPECNKPQPQICTLQCIIGCQCKSGYLRKNNQCVSPSDC